VTGSGKSVGEPLVKHPSVRKISFTGNVSTGLRIRDLAYQSLKAITLELGGSDPMIVMSDADLDKAVEGAVKGRFYNAGQTCTAVKRLYLHEAIAEPFIRKMKEKVESLHIGNGLLSGIDMGPMNNNLQRERIAGMLDEVRDKNIGTILTGGCALQEDAYKQGCFYCPTLVTDVVPGSRLVTEELFGPVLPVMTVPDLETAIHEANNTRFGLGASIWTSNLATTRRAFDGIRAGIVWVNRHLTVPPEIPFGGTNDSGIGRENGSHALDQYSETKTLFLGW
jgi:succinate-semialdehyde dehydrogenase/glutarate-semialdehyde dehydrogenase